MAPNTDPTEALKHQYELEKELRERTAKELETHEKNLGELFTARNDHEVRVDRLEQAEGRRRWLIRVLIIAVAGLIVKSLWPIAVPLYKATASGGIGP